MFSLVALSGGEQDREVGLPAQEAKPFTLTSAEAG